jgi:hypothetical protein
MPGVLAAWKSLLKLAREAAVGWGQETKPIELLEADAKDKIGKSNSEQWMINKAVHYNAWATLQAKEFEKVMAAWKAMLESMQCSKCREIVYVTPRKGPKEALRCDCGKVNLNLNLG